MFIYKKSASTRVYFDFEAPLKLDGRPERKYPSLHGQKFNPNPKFLGIWCATSIQCLRYLCFMPSLRVRSPWLEHIK